MFQEDKDVGPAGGRGGGERDEVSIHLFGVGVVVVEKGMREERRREGGGEVREDWSEGIEW